MELYIVTQDRKKYIPVTKPIKLKGKLLKHGWTKLGEYKTEKEAQAVFNQITQQVGNYHQFTKNDEVYIAFASVADTYIMPTVEELETKEVAK